MVSKRAKGTRVDPRGTSLGKSKTRLISKVAKDNTAMALVDELNADGDQTFKFGHRPVVRSAHTHAAH